MRLASQLEAVYNEVTTNFDRRDQRSTRRAQLVASSLSQKSSPRLPQFILSMAPTGFKLGFVKYSLAEAFLRSFRPLVLGWV